MRDSDGTLILATGDLTGGTAYTAEYAARIKKPCLIIEPARKENVKKLIRWIQDNSIAVMNVAGPRESTVPGIYEKAFDLLYKLLKSIS